jgi:uncharacterized membrane protein
VRRGWWEVHDAVELINVISRWLHIASAVILVGGFFFIAVAVEPALRGAADGLAEAIRRRYKRVAHTAAGLLLITGFYNYLALAAPKAHSLGIGAEYNAVMGMKILLAVCVIGISIVLLAPVRLSDATRARWLLANVALGLAVLAAGAFLRRLWP